MMNAIIIFYDGYTPQKCDVEHIYETVTALSFCEEVHEIKHFDSDSMCKAIVNRSIDQDNKKKCCIFVQNIQQEQRTNVAHKLESLLGITFSKAYSMLEDGKIIMPNNIDADVVTRIICDGGGNIVGPSKYAISQALYLMNSYSNRRWDLIRIIEQIHKNISTKETEAVKNAVEILRSEAIDTTTDKIDEGVKTIINLM